MRHPVRCHPGGFAADRHARLSAVERRPVTPAGRRGSWPLPGTGGRDGLSDPGGRAGAVRDCADWNSYGFFETAGAGEVRACLRAGADLHARDKNNGSHPAALGCVLRPCRRGRGAARRRGRSNARNEGGDTPFDVIPEDSPLIGTPAYWRLNDARWD